MIDDPSFLPIGTQLSLKYKVIGHIGAGGCGKTYLVSNVLGFGENLVVKEFYVAKMCVRDAATKKVSVSNENRESFENLREKFKKEAIKVSQLDHPNIVKVVDLFEANDTVYFVMNRVNGESLADKISRGEKLSEARIMRYLNQMLDALEYIHSRKPVGIMHLDIKPANIMIDENDNVVLIDFGASKSFNSTSVNQTLMSTVGLLYTPGYAPIEQENGNIKDLGSHCDIYALGATLFKLFTGQTPPKPYDIIKKGLPAISGASPLMQRIIKKALEFDYDRRIKSVAEFRAMLRDEELTEPDPTPNPRNDDPTLTSPQETPGTPTTTGAPEPEFASTPRLEKKDGKVGTLSEYLKKKPIKIASGVVLMLVLALTGYLTYDAVAVESRTITVNGVSFDMVKVEGGTFTMGATSEQDSDACGNEKPAHEVTLGDYYIGRYEVTQALWEAVMGSNPSCFKGTDLPVERVSWHDCDKFIKTLNTLTGLRFRLPTEAEWEYAARGGNKSRGYKYSGGNTIGDVAWHYGNSSSKTHPVGGKTPNELDLYDMSGNVWEWCSDWYDSSYYTSSPSTDPTGPSTGSIRVDRGGSWYGGARLCRVARRDYYFPVHSNDILGLRFAL